MNNFKCLAISFAIVTTMLTHASTASASECGLSCCIAAGIDGVGSHTGLNASLIGDFMLMETIKQGTTNITPSQIIDEQLAAVPTGMMGMFAVPTKMVMQKTGLNLSYRTDEDNAFVVTLPYIKNDMDMRVGKKDAFGNITTRTVKMDTIQGLGDISLLYMFDVYKDNFLRTRKRLSIGVGLKASTGKHQARNASGNLVHMMMQAGSGAWDGLFSINGSLGFGDHDDGGALWIVLPSLFYQANSRNDLGYKVGNRLNYDIDTTYRLSSKFNLTLGLNGVKSSADTTDGTIDTATGLVAYQIPSKNLLDNVANTGVHSMFLSPGFLWLFGDGYNLNGEYRAPIFQNARGTLQVTNQWFFLRLSKNF